MFPHERQQRLVDYCDAQEVPTGAPARARMRIDGTCCLRKRANAIVRDCDALGMQPRLSKNRRGHLAWQRNQYRHGDRPGLLRCLQ